MLKKQSVAITQLMLATFGVTIPWEMIFELITQLIAQCFESEARFRTAAKNPTAEDRLVMNVMIRRTLGIWGRKKVVGCQEAIYLHAAEMAEGDIDACHAEVTGRLNYDMDPSKDTSA